MHGMSTRDAESGVAVMREARRLEAAGTSSDSAADEGHGATLAQNSTTRLLVYVFRPTWSGHGLAADSGPCPRSVAASRSATGPAASATSAALDGALRRDHVREHQGNEQPAHSTVPCALTRDPACSSDAGQRGTDRSQDERDSKSPLYPRRAPESLTREPPLSPPKGPQRRPRSADQVP